MGYDRTARARDIADDVRAAAVVARFAPGALDAPILAHLPFIRLQAILGGALFAGEAPPDLGPMWLELEALPGGAPSRTEPPAPAAPRSDYEDTGVPRGSARIAHPEEVPRWGTAEIVLTGPTRGNPYTDVELWADFRSEDGTVLRVGGFYDGHGMYRIRFGAPDEGTWHFTTGANARSMDGIAGRVEVVASREHGPVRVRDRFHFAHHDGTPFLPLGTTLYAWSHQDAHLRARTLRTLSESSFTKARMCVFPKSYLFNDNEPDLYPFLRDAAGEWDFARPDPGFFRRFEDSIADLAALGVQADLILFHSYDRWGFSEMPAWADDLIARYLVRRLAAIPSVWWALANEYDLLPGKSVDDWERIAALVQAEDHVGHLTSIHNCFGFYDHARPWITHCSIQRQDVYRTAEYVDEWRELWGKPVVIDEVGYEGDIDQGWGNLTGRELVRRAWEGAVRGGYVNHGETFVNDREELWWAKGGDLVGESPARFAFLAARIAEMPASRLDPLPSDWDARWAGGDDVRLVYFGFSQPSYRWFTLPPEQRWRVEILDTWEMTVTALPGEYGGRFRIDLPAKQYLAVRLSRIDPAG